MLLSDQHRRRIYHFVINLFEFYISINIIISIKGFDYYITIIRWNYAHQKNQRNKLLKWNMYFSMNKNIFSVVERGDDRIWVGHSRQYFSRLVVLVRSLIIIKMLHLIRLAVVLLFLNFLKSVNIFTAFLVKFDSLFRSWLQCFNLIILKYEIIEIKIN